MLPSAEFDLLVAGLCSGAATFSCTAAFFSSSTATFSSCTAAFSSSAAAFSCTATFVSCGFVCSSFSRSFFSRSRTSCGGYSEAACDCQHRCQILLHSKNPLLGRAPNLRPHAAIRPIAQRGSRAHNTINLAGSNSFSNSVPNSRGMTIAAFPTVGHRFAGVCAKCIAWQTPTEAIRFSPLPVLEIA